MPLTSRRHLHRPLTLPRCCVDADVTELVVADENVVIRLPGLEHVVAELRRKNTAPSMSGRDSLQADHDDDGRVLNVSLPEFTEYLLDVFEPRPGGGLEHIQTYAISRVAPATDDASNDETHDDVCAAEAAKLVTDDRQREKLASAKKASGTSCRGC